MKTAANPSLSLFHSSVLFGLFTLLLFSIVTYVLPYLRDGQELHPALSWFIGGTFIFKPMLLLAIGLAWAQSRFTTWAGLRQALGLRPLSRRDWRYSLLGLGGIFAGMGLIVGIAYILNRYANFPPLSMTPPALSFPPFVGNERWLLLAWAVMFFFNIVGEECLWRGYILQRQIPRLGLYAWLVNGAFWALFHLPFGWSMVIMAAPAFLIVPFVFQQTRNTTTGIVMHGLMNGPVFVAISLGLVNTGGM